MTSFSWLDDLKATDSEAYESIKRYLSTPAVDIPHSTTAPSSTLPPLPLYKQPWPSQSQKETPSMAMPAKVHARIPSSHLDQQGISQQYLPPGLSSVQNIRVEYQTTTFSSPASSHHINLQPPTQVSPTSNARGSPMLRPSNLDHTSTRHDLQPAFHQPASSRSEYQGQNSQHPVKQQPMKHYHFPEVPNEELKQRSQLDLDRLDEEKQRRRKIEVERMKQEQERRRLFEQERLAREQQQQRQLQQEKQKQEEEQRYQQQMRYQQQQRQHHQQQQQKFNLQQYDHNRYHPQEVQSQKPSPVQYASQPSQQSQNQSRQHMQFTQPHQQHQNRLPQPLPQNKPSQAQEYSFSHILSPAQPTPTRTFSTSNPEFSNPIPSNSLSITSSKPPVNQLQPPKEPQSWTLLPKEEEDFFHRYMVESIHPLSGPLASNLRAFLAYQLPFSKPQNQVLGQVGEVFPQLDRMFPPALAQYIRSALLKGIEANKRHLQATQSVQAAQAAEITYLSAGKQGQQHQGSQLQYHTQYQPQAQFPKAEPVFRGELYKNLIQRDAAIPPRSETGSPQLPLLNSQSIALAAPISNMATSTESAISSGLQDSPQQPAVDPLQQPPDKKPRKPRTPTKPKLPSPALTQPAQSNPPPSTQQTLPTPLPFKAPLRAPIPAPAQAIPTQPSFPAPISSAVPPPSSQWSQKRIASLIGILFAVRCKSLTAPEEQIFAEIMSHDRSPEIVFNELVKGKIITPEQLQALRTGFGAFDKVNSKLPDPAPAAVQIQPTQPAKPASPGRRSASKSNTKVQKTKSPATNNPKPKITHEEATRIIHNNLNTVNGCFIRMFQEYALQHISPDKVKEIADAVKGIENTGIAILQRAVVHLFKPEDLKRVQLWVQEKVDRFSQQQAAKRAFMADALGTGAEGNSTRQVNGTTLAQSQNVGSSNGTANGRVSTTQNGVSNSSAETPTPSVNTAKKPKTSRKTSVIAHCVPNRELYDLSPMIASWPVSSIASNILIAAGRPVPSKGNDSASTAGTRLNQGLEIITLKYKDLKKAELTTLEWDLLDPVYINLDNSKKETSAVAFNKGLEAGQKVIKPILQGDTTPSGPSSGRVGAVPIGLTKFSELDTSTDPSLFSNPPNLLGILGLPVKQAHKKTLITKPIETSNPSDPSVADLVAEVRNSGPKSPKSILGKSAFKRVEPGTPKKPAPYERPENYNPSTSVMGGIISGKDSGKESVKRSGMGSGTPRMIPEVVITKTPQRTPGMAMVFSDEYLRSLKEGSGKKRSRTREKTISPLAKKSNNTLSSRKSTPTKARAKRSTPTTSPTINGLARRTTIDLTTVPINSIPLNHPSSPSLTSGSSSSPPADTPERFLSYSCLWQNCKAQLHSYDTLEQHVLKVHGKVDPRTKSPSWKCLWGDCPKTNVREYSDREEWEFHVQRMHLLQCQFACSHGDCKEMFATNETLAEHAKTHINPINASPAGNNRKRKHDEITPTIVPMPSDMAKRYRPVYSGPSRTFSVGQKRK